MNSIKIFSWNILGPQTKDVPWFEQRYHAVTNWPHRFDIIIRKIIQLNPEIICMQEIDLEQKATFTKILKSHGYDLACYESKGPHGGVILLYKTDRFTVSNHGSVQINPFQEFHHASACAWATLIDKQTQQSILITSAHFQPKHIFEQFDTWLNHLHPLSRTIPLVIIGDFNTKYTIMHKEVLPHLHGKNISAYAIKMFEHHSWTHQSTVKHDHLGGWSGVDHMLYTDNLKIDMNHSFVGNSTRPYVTDLVTTTTANILDHTKHPVPSEEFPSDHLPLLATILLSES